MEKPCSTPTETGWKVHWEAWNTRWQVMSRKKELIQCIGYGLTPLRRRKECRTDDATLSKTPFMSTNRVETFVRRKPISKSCEITQADNLNRRRRLSRKAQ